MCPCTAMSRAPKKTSISRSVFFVFFFKPVRVADDCERRPILCRDASTPVTTDCAYAIRASWTPLRRGVNNWRNSPAKSGRLIGCAPGHQVTPRLRALFRAGAPGDSSPSRAFPRRGIRWLLAFARFPAQGHQATPRLHALFRAGASGDSSPSRAFPRRGIRWLLAFARFSAQGHQVTPRLRALFSAGASGVSSPSRAFLRRGIRWLLAFARRGIIWLTAALRRRAAALLASGWATEAGTPCHHEWVRERSPLHTAAADVGLVSCEWESVLYTRQLLMWGWYHVNESDLYTRQPLMWGWYHVNERVSSTHGRPLSGGWYRVNKRAVSSKHGSRWWGAGIVWMSEEPSDCALYTADRRSKAGGCMLRQWAVRHLRWHRNP